MIVATKAGNINEAIAAIAWNDRTIIVFKKGMNGYVEKQYVPYRDVIGVFEDEEAIKKLGFGGIRGRV